MSAELGTPEGERLDFLATLVDSYERQHFPLDLPDPIATLRFVMESRELTPKDLEPMIGRRNRVYEVLGGKRALTLDMIWRLHEQLGIPAESLIKRPARRRGG
jgi:HTH-type transcriptional regulator/antitoxin HigA